MRGQKKLFFIIFLLTSNILFLFSVDYEIYKKDAIVSYYAGDFHGKKTSNGETFNMNALTCASKTLPFNTILKVTNLSNGKSVTVRVNDRGPFIPNRELDLSKAAAIKLDMIKTGTTHARIEIVKRGVNTKLSQKTAQKAVKMMKERFPNEYKPSSNNSKKIEYDIQLASFSTKDNANKYAQKLLKKGFNDVVFQKGNDTYRVVIRKVQEKDLEELEERLESYGYKDYIVRRRNK